jgi:hypothetical protein
MALEKTLTNAGRRQPCESGNASAGVQSATDDLPRLRAPQYSLRTLFWFVSAASALFAVMSVVGALWSSAIVWLLVLVAVHVAANAWGSRVGRRGARLTLPDDGPPIARAAPHAFAPSTRLRRNVALAGTTLATTCLGAGLGAGTGAMLLWATPPGPAGWAGFVVGTLSAAVVGGFLGFLTSSFLDVALGALGEASREHNRPASRLDPD